MIKISVDEAYALDVLAISLVKSRKAPSIAAYKNYFDFAIEIKSQISLDKFSEIIDSPEFDALVDANDKVFDGVDLAKKDGIPASALDSLNYQRFLCKKKIQEKFFNGEMSERKIGYETLV